MKTFAAIICFALLAAVCADLNDFTDEQKALAKEYSDACTKELNLSEAEIAKLKEHDFSEPSENVKCFANCYLEKIGTLKNGVVQEDIVFSKFGKLSGEAEIRAILAKCKDVKGKNNCETAFQLFECYMKAKLSVVA